MNRFRAKRPSALPPGVLNAGKFPDTERATRAFLAWALAAHEAGRELGALAVLVNDAGDIGVSVTLATREHWAFVTVAALGDDAEDVLKEFRSPDAKDALRVVVSHGNDRFSSFALTLTEMKEAVN